jgi:hypothetical protein
MKRAIGAFGFLLLSLASASTARADDKTACVDAYGKAQRLRSANQLVSARAQLRSCAQTSCPKFIAKDCAAWLGDVESLIPSVVPFARDSNGAELSSATVSMDGTVIAEQLDGHAIEVDAGRHTFTFTFGDGRKADQTYVVLEGQKAQRVGVTMAAAAPSTAAPSSASAEQVSTVPAPVSTSGWNGRKTLAVVVGGVGLAGVAVGSVFGLNAFSSYSSQQSDCRSPGNCSRAQAQTDHDNAVTASTISTISFAAGGALVVTGAVLFFTAPRGNERVEGSASAGWQVAPTAGPGAAGLLLRGRF